MGLHTFSDTTVMANVYRADIEQKRGCLQETPICYSKSMCSTSISSVTNMRATSLNFSAFSVV